MMENNNKNIEDLLKNGHQSSANYSYNTPRQSSGVGVLIALICGCLVIGLLLGTPIGYLVSAPFSEETIYYEDDDYDYEASYYTTLLTNMKSAIRYYDMPELVVGEAYQVPFTYEGENAVVTIDSLTVGKKEVYGDKFDALSIVVSFDNTTSEEVYASVTSLIRVFDQDGNEIDAEYYGDTTNGDVAAGDRLVLDDIYDLSGVSEITVRIYGSSTVPSAESTFKVSELSQADATSL